MSQEQTVQQPAENKPVPVEKPSSIGELPKVKLATTGEEVGFYTSILPTTPTNKSRIYNAIAGEAKPLESFMDKMILVEHIVCIPTSFRESVSGKMVSGLRTVLVAPNGAMYGCVSEGVYGSLKKLSSVFGDPPWPTGMVVIPKRVKTKLGHTYALERPTEKDEEAFRKELEREEREREADRKANPKSKAK